MLPSLDTDLLFLLLGVVVIAVAIRGLLWNLRGFHAPWSGSIRVDERQFIGSWPPVPQTTLPDPVDAPNAPPSPASDTASSQAATPSKPLAAADDAALETLAADIAFVRANVSNLLEDVRELRRRTHPGAAE